MPRGAFTTERMKMRRPHDVPLSTQALAIIRDIWPLSESHELVLPSIRSPLKALSENAMNSALRRMGYRQARGSVPRLPLIGEHYSQ